MTMTGFDYLATMTEAQFQNTVERLADTFRWKWFHPPDDEAMRKTRGGFPDLVMVRDSLVIFAELKRQNSHPTKKQDEWHRALSQVETFSGNVIVRIWRPGNLPEIAELLKKGWRVQL